MPAHIFSVTQSLIVVPLRLLSVPLRCGFLVHVTARLNYMIQQLSEAVKPSFIPLFAVSICF
jgi:hypothetical protein